MVKGQGRVVGGRGSQCLSGCNTLLVCVGGGQQSSAPWQQQNADEEDYSVKSVAEIRQKFNAPPAPRKHGGTVQQQLSFLNIISAEEVIFSLSSIS